MMSILAIETYGSGSITNSFTAENTIVQHNYKRWSSVRKVFQQVFLPQGYPESVSEDYLEYQIWDTIQAFSSSVTGTLASQALLKGYGVGDEKATVLAATITWLLKDGAGMVGRILFAWTKGTFLDCDCKRWRFFADIMNDFAIFLELMAPRVDGLFTPIVCVASVAKSIVGVAGGSTRAALGVHQARRNNMADVSAKDGSQETMVNLMALLFNFLFIHWVTGNNLLIWTSFILFTCVHLFANYRAVCALKMETFNLTRYLLFTRNYLRSGGRVQLGVKAGNVMEPVVLPISKYNRIVLGASFANSTGKCPVHFRDIISLFQEENFMLIPNQDNSCVNVIFHDHCSELDMLKAVFTSEIFFQLNEGFNQHSQVNSVECLGMTVALYQVYPHGIDVLKLLSSALKVSCSHFDLFIRRAHNVGWQLSPTLLGADEWRCNWRLTA